MNTPPVCHAIIPARYASTRFPGKPLAMILGRPMIWHVYTRAMACPSLASVTLATDDERILDACAELNIPALQTSSAHPSGTDRVLEAARALDLPPDAVVVNVQGDEPALRPEMLTQLTDAFEDPAVQVATLAKEVPAAMVRDPNRAKVVTDAAGNALYFSRAPIPFDRDLEPGCAVPALVHIGLYAFRVRALELFASLPLGRLEDREKLEQLRLLENGIPIRVMMTQHDSVAVDHPEDIAKAEAAIREQGLPFCPV